MIHFDEVPEPAAFRERAAVPGVQWLEEHPDGRPPAYWTQFRIQLADGFNNLCAYAAMYEAVGTVDHFVSIDEDRSRAYDWSNYRFASAWANSRKSRAPSSDVLDPYAVEDGWFEVLLPSLQLVATDAVPPELRPRAEFVLDRLHLRDHVEVIRCREAWYSMYREGNLTLDGLAQKAPLIARAVRASQQRP